MEDVYNRDLFSLDGLLALDDILRGKSYISGEEMTKDDAELYSLFSGIKPGSVTYPNLSKWYQAVEDKLISSYLGKDCGQAASVGPAAQPQEVTAEALRMNLHTVEGLIDLDDKLCGKSYISGEEMTRDDVEVYALFGGKRPNAKYYPNARRWHRAVSEKLALSVLGKDGRGGQAAADVKRMLEKTAAEENRGMLRKRKRDEDTEEEKRKVAEEREVAASEGCQCCLLNGGMESTTLTMWIPWTFDEKRSERYKKEIQEYVRNLDIDGLLCAEPELYFVEDELILLLCLTMEDGIGCWACAVVERVWSRMEPWLCPQP